MVKKNSGPLAVKSLVGDPELVEKRRSQITQAAGRLFATVGYHETTIKHIADAAGISPGLIYQYVEEKHDLLYLAIIDVIQKKENEIPQAIALTSHPLLRFLAVARAYIRIHDTHRHAVILTYRHIHSLPRKYVNDLMQKEIASNSRIASVIRDCIKAGVFRAADPDLAAHYLVVMAQAWATKYWRFRNNTSIDAYVENCVEFLLSALLSPDGKLAQSEGLNKPI